MQSFAIIPAAGASRRMGRPKLLLPWREGVVIEAVLDAWKRGGVDHAIVVVREDDQPLADVCRRAGAAVCSVSPPPPQMKDSIQHGLADVSRRLSPSAADAWLLAPADMPSLSPDVIRVLLQTHEASERPQILSPTVNGKRGHPVLFPWPLAAEVERLAAGEGVNVLRKRHSCREINVADASILDDLDTPDDYRRLLEDGCG